MNKIIINVYVPIIVFISAMIEILFIQLGGIKLIALNVVALMPLFLFGFLGGKIAVLSFSIDNNFYKSIGKFILLVGCFTMYLCSILALIILPNINVVQSTMPKYGNLSFIAHPSVFFLGVAIGLKYVLQNSKK